jgi:hypothetical protein
VVPAAVFGHGRIPVRRSEVEVGLNFTNVVSVIKPTDR